MPSFIDLSGRTFNRLYVMEWHGKINGRSMWHCFCECGTHVLMRADSLESGHTKSCGCHKHDVDVLRKLTHGMTGTRIHQTWLSMNERCSNPQGESWEDYGGRGIKVCERWLKFENFHADMGDRPKGMTLERKNVNGNYEPNNCEWATRADQNRNTRRNVMLEMDGVSMPRRTWALKFGVHEMTLKHRLKMGWSLKDALTVAPYVKPNNLLHTEVHLKSFAR